MANFTGRTTTNITLHLIIINVILLLADGLLERRGISLSDMLGLHYLDSEKFHWWQLVTYMFMHGNLTHLFNNMFSLYMFGRLLEMVWGEQRFLLYYFVTGIGAGLIQQLAWSYELNNFIAQFATNDVFRQQILNMSHTQLLEVDGVMNILNQLVTVGASGSVFGILLAFGMMFPNAEIFLLIPPMPLKAKWLFIGYGAFELFAGVYGIQTGVAHFAHLGGMLFGFLLILLWKNHRNCEF